MRAPAVRVLQRSIFLVWQVIPPAFRASALIQSHVWAPEKLSLTAGCRISPR